MEMRVWEEAGYPSTHNACQLSPCPHALPRKGPNVPSLKSPRALGPFFNPRLMFLWTLSRHQQAFSPLL